MSHMGIWHRLCDFGIPAGTLRQVMGGMVYQKLVIQDGNTAADLAVLLHYLAHRYLAEKMVLTIEDPVEVVQPNFLQLQVNKAAQMDYPDLLKLALRHHPDVMIIGEIRDAQTKLYLRISSVGDFLNRESIVVRLIFAVDDQHIQLTSQSDVGAIGETMMNGAGLILLAGQMGSGKTTTGDLYVMPGEAGYRVFCYTATGIQPLADLTLANGEALIRHIKFEAQMDISETRRPQLGRWCYLLDKEYKQYLTRDALCITRFLLS
ncbi:Flp pilus assembly complex ATPase component TadA [Weissella confusa]|uniref:Flp pilus assembly complex ATPase component TadA n=1 Tax=Weissella confusa TaxID=1583 RepID=A0A923SPZ6_WEICO|nr:Flp pilus assembly complex ATPase component TadA [Weissella confusa]